MRTRRDGVTVPVTVLVPGALRGEVDGAARLDVDATGTLGDVLR